MEVNVHLAFLGQCEEAFKVYEKCLGGKIVTMMTWGESPMADRVVPAMRDKIIHATLAVGESRFSGGDSPAENYQRPVGMSVALNLKNPEDAERIFKTLAENSRCKCRFRRPFGPCASACLWIVSESPG